MADSSSDVDEFASNFDATTTPFRSTKIDVVNRTTNGHAAVAGPSSKPARARGTRKRSPSPAEKYDVEDETALTVPPSKKGKGKQTLGRTQSSAAPVKTKTAESLQKGKGKGKAVASQEAIEIIAIDSATDGAERDAPPRSNWKLREERLERQLDHLRAQIQDITSQRDSFARQLDETLYTEKVELEEILEQQKILYESRLQTQEEMIQELTSQLARVDTLTREGKTSTLHFLTREAADEERRGIERQVAQIKEALSNKDKTIAEMNRAIRERDDTIRTLQSDLNIEIERSKSLTSRTRDAPTSSQAIKHLETFGDDTPMNGQVVRLYEDMTNLLVINVKYEKVDDSSSEQIVFICILTDVESEKALNFSLRMYTDDEEPVEKVAYTPLQLDKEQAGFAERLSFFSEPFTFRRAQLDVFRKNITNALKRAFGEEGEEEEED